MGKLKIMFSMFVSEKISRCFMLVFIVLVIMASNISIKLVDDALSLKKISESVNFSDAFYFSKSNKIISGMSHDAQEKMNDLLKDLYDAGVSIGEIKYTYTYMDFFGENTFFIDYNDVLVEKVSLPLSEGTWFSTDASNEVILPYEYRNKYELNEIIQIEGIQLQIIGFLDKGNYVLEFTSSGYIGYDDLFKKEKHVILVNGVTDGSGLPYAFSSDSSGMVIFEANMEALENISIYGSTQEMSQMQADYIESVNEKFHAQLGIEVVLLILTVSGFFALNFISIYQKRNEYGVYYICGMNRGQILRMAIQINGIVAVLALIVVVVIAVVCSSVQNYLKFANIIGTFGLLFFILLCSSVPFYIIMRRESVISLIRR